MSNPVLISRELLRSLIIMSKDQVQGHVGASGDLGLNVKVGS